MKTNFKMIAKSLCSLGLSVMLLLMVSSCGNTQSENTSVKKADSVKAANSVDNAAMTDETDASSGTSGSAVLTVKETLDKAKKNGNAVFLIVTGKEDTELKKAIAIAETANKSVKKSIVLQMDRDDKNNAALVKEFGVVSAPLPLFLVISQGGALAGGFTLTDATADKLAKSIPSPKHEAVLLALNNKKNVFVVLAKKTFTDKDKVVENCKSAVTQMAGKSELVQIDLDDSKEKTFIGLLGINTTTVKTATVVIHSSGQVNGTFYEIKDVASLVTIASTLAKKGGCAPGACGASSKGCGK